MASADRFSRSPAEQVRGGLSTAPDRPSMTNSAGPRVGLVWGWRVRTSPEWSKTPAQSTKTPQMS